MKDLLADKTIERSAVRINLSFSDSTYNDYIRRLNDFVQLSDNSTDTLSKLGYYLAELIVIRNSNLLYYKIVFLDYYAKDALSYANHLTKQQQYIWSELCTNADSFTYRVKLIVRVLAAGKSTI
jgi:hypothetical protein